MMSRLTKVSRRKKRIKNRNGDRQFEIAVRNFRRDRIRKWTMEHDKPKAVKQLAQQAFFAARRTAKEQLRAQLKELAAQTGPPF